MIKSILLAIFRALERSGQARARRFINIHRGTSQ